MLTEVILSNPDEVVEQPLIENAQALLDQATNHEQADAVSPGTPVTPVEYKWLLEENIQAELVTPSPSNDPFLEPSYYTLVPLEPIVQSVVPATQTSETPLLSRPNMQYKLPNVQPEPSKTGHKHRGTQKRSSHTHGNSRKVQPKSSNIQANHQREQPESSNIQPNRLKVQPTLSDMQPNRQRMEPDSSNVQPHFLNSQTTNSNDQTIFLQKQFDMQQYFPHPHHVVPNVAPINMKPTAPQMTQTSPNLPQTPRRLQTASNIQPNRQMRQHQPNYLNNETTITDNKALFLHMPSQPLQPQSSNALTMPPCSPNMQFIVMEDKGQSSSNTPQAHHLEFNSLNAEQEQRLTDPAMESNSFIAIPCRSLQQCSPEKLFLNSDDLTEYLM